jgi:hypothetical protein
MGTIVVSVARYGSGAAAAGFTSTIALAKQSLHLKSKGGVKEPGPDALLDILSRLHLDP